MTSGGTFATVALGTLTIRQRSGILRYAARLSRLWEREKLRLSRRRERTRYSAPVASPGENLADAFLILRGHALARADLPSFSAKITAPRLESSMGEGGTTVAQEGGVVNSNKRPDVPRDLSELPQTSRTSRMETSMTRFQTILPAAIAVMVLCVMASPVRAGISGSKHDFGQFGWAKNEICLPCHTPHNAIVRDAN